MNSIKERVKEKSFLLFFLFSMVIPSFSFLIAQNQPYSVIPSSPISKSFDRYGDYPISLFTGVPEITIPIYEIESGGIVLPISISYHASGIKVTDVSYPVGLGWVLNAGGRVSRTVNDKPDEQYIGIGNYVGTYTGSTPTQLMEVTDNESDWFNYQLGVQGSNSGKFLFDGVETYNNGNKLKTPVFFPPTDMKFLYNANNGLELTDEQGRNFTFSYREFTGANTYYYPSAWLLSEIMPANKQASDKISFTYQPGPTIVSPLLEGAMTIIDSAYIKGQIFVSQNSGTTTYSSFLGNHNLYTAGFTSIAGRLGVTYNNPYNSPQHPYKRINDADLNVNAFMSNYDPNNQTTHAGFLTHGYPEYSTSNITTIQFKGGHIEFIYNSAGSFLQQIKVFNASALIKTINFYNSAYNSWNRFKLDSMVVSNTGSIERQTYSFQYENGIAEEQSNYPYLYNARDHWNFYNGEVTNSTAVPKWTGIPTVTSTNRIEQSNDGNYFWTVDETRYANVEIGTANREASEQYLKKYIIKKIKYPTGGYTDFEFESNKCTTEDPNTGNPILKDVGGLRISKVKSFDDNGSPLIKEYSYGIDENNFTGAGVIRNVPTYDDYIYDCFYLFPDMGDLNPNDPTVMVNWTGTPTDVYARKRDLLSTPVNPLVHVDGSPIWYTYVEEVEKDESGNQIGKTSYKFDLPITTDQQEFYLSQTAGSYLQSKFNSLIVGFNTPLLSEKKIYQSYNSGFRILQSTQYNHTEEYSTSPTVKMYPWKTVLKFIGYPYVNTNQRYDDVDMVGQYVYPVTFYTYRNSITDYSYTNSNTQLTATTSTEYTYTSPSHLLPREITTTNSLGGTINKKITYPTDYNNLTGQDDITKGIKNLQLSNIISAPIEQITTRKDANQTNPRVIGAGFTSYKPNQPFPDKLYAAEINNPLANFSQSTVVNGSIVVNPLHKLKLQADNYNLEGDITEQHLSDNIPTSYLWGYNKMYPVVQVVGASQASIMGLVDQNILDNPPSDQALRTELNNIRTGLSATKALVTTYTYKPLIGISSQTDPNNRTTYYEYDAFNRLKLIRDQDNNIIKKICYNYAGQVENCIPCTDLSANWQNTSTALRCQLNGSSQNTGYQEQEQKDINSCSSTYNQLRWVSAGYNVSACPLPPQSCSFSMSSGFITPYNTISSTGNTVSFNLVYYSYSTMVLGTEYMVATISSGCRPVTNKTMTLFNNGRSFYVTIYASTGMMGIRMISGTDIPAYTTIGLTSTYDKSL